MVKLAKFNPRNIKHKISTREIDHGFKGIIKELKKLENKPYVKVGYPSKKAPTKDKKLKRITLSQENDLELIVQDEFVTVLDVAIFHEFGTVRLDERSFVRASFDKNRKKYEATNKKLLIDIYSGKKTVEQALDILGIMILTDIKSFLTDGEVKPDSIRAASENGKTLIDTAQLLNAITFIRVMKS